MRAADGFLYQYKEYKKVQFDVISVTQRFNGETEFYLIEDVFI